MIAAPSEWKIRGDGWAVRVAIDEDKDDPDMRWCASINFADGSISGESIYAFAGSSADALAKLRAKMEPIGAKLAAALAQSWDLPELKGALDFSEFEKL